MALAFGTDFDGNSLFSSVLIWERNESDLPFWSGRIRNPFQITMASLASRAAALLAPALRPDFYFILFFYFLPHLFLVTYYTDFFHTIYHRHRFSLWIHIVYYYYKIISINNSNRYSILCLCRRSSSTSMIRKNIPCESTHDPKSIFGLQPFVFWSFGLLVFGFWSLVFECFGLCVFGLRVVFGLFGLWSLIVVLVFCLWSFGL